MQVQTGKPYDYPKCSHGLPSWTCENHSAGTVAPCTTRSGRTPAEWLRKAIEHAEDAERLFKEYSDCQVMCEYDAENFQQTLRLADTALAIAREMREQG